MFPGAKQGPAGHESGSNATPGGAWQNLRRAATALGVLLVALNTVGGCGSNKNYDQREAFASTLPDDGKAGVYANDNPTGCLGQCQRDPGSPLMDCAAEEAGLEFLPLQGWNFDGTVASSLYSYTDKSAQNLTPRGWEPPTVEIKRCLGAEVEKGFHLSGGPYRDWGGGFGVRLELALTAGECGTDDPAFRADYCQPIGTEPPFDVATFNLTQWDGLSFWARRGPDGQPLLRVMIADQRTDDDISYKMSSLTPAEPRFCERNRECGCPLGLPCSEVPADKRDLVDNDCADNTNVIVDPLFICWDPVTDPDLQQYRPHTLCGTAACDCPYEAFAEDPDPLFSGRSCSEFAFRGGIVDDYCFVPGQDPNPHEASDLCGDHWASPVHLTTDWQFFKVPFTSLLQQGWAKEQHQFDLNAVSMVRFTWDKGFIDYWLDDVRFYREKPE